MEETFRRATEEDPSPGWTDAIDVMCRFIMLSTYSNVNPLASLLYAQSESHRMK